LERSLEDRCGPRLERVARKWRVRRKVLAVEEDGEEEESCGEEKRKEPMAERKVRLEEEDD